MNQAEKAKLERECAKLLAPMLRGHVDIPSGKRPIIMVSVSFEDVPVDPLVHIDVASRVRWVASDQPFTDKEFRELLTLPLSSHDREFVDFFRTRKNKPLTINGITEAGFAEKGRMASINAICRRNGLMLGFRQLPGRHPSWLETPHRFFVLQEAT